MTRAGRRTPQSSRRRNAKAPGGNPDAPLVQAELLGIPDEQWVIARRRMRLVKIVLGSKARGMGRYEAVARKARVTPRALYRWAATWLRDRTLSSLLPRKLGPKPGHSRLGHEREIIV